MLSRLMKYEMRSQSRLLLPLHALLLLASILGRFLLQEKFTNGFQLLSLSY